MPYIDFRILSANGNNKRAYAYGKTVDFSTFGMYTENGEICKFSVDYNPNRIPKNAKITEARLYVSYAGGVKGKLNFGVLRAGGDRYTPRLYDLTGGQTSNSFNSSFLSDYMSLWNDASNNKEVIPQYFEYYEDRVSMSLDFIRVYYEYNTPQASGALSPDKTTVNPRTPIKFTWDSQVDQEAYEFSYRVDSGSWTTKTMVTGDRFYEMPAGTITQLSGNLDWRVRVKERSGIWSDYTYASVTLGAVAQRPPILVYPVGDYVKNASNISLKWQFVSNTVEEQKEAQVKVRIGTGSWSTFTTTKEEIKPDILNAKLDPNYSGTVLWKARTKNQFDEWSDWTDEAQFQIVGTPPIPTIVSVSKINKPTIKWTSSEQEAFVIKVMKDDKLVYDSGIVVGANVREYKLKSWLETGNYTIELNVINKFDIKSPTAKHTFDISPSQGLEKPDISILNLNRGILVKSSTKTGEVYRDNVLIGQLKDGLFEDFTGTNEAKSMYFVRAIKDDNFVDSDKKQGITNLLGGSTLALVENPKDYIVLDVNLDAYPKKKVDFEIEAAKIPLNGRKHDFIEFGEGETEKLTLNYALENIYGFIRLVKARKEIIYRDSYGFVFEGIISSFDYELGMFGYLINFTIEKTGEKYEFKKNKL